jgi:hypothetical protein
MAWQDSLISQIVSWGCDSQLFFAVQLNVPCFSRAPPHRKGKALTFCFGVQQRPSAFLLFTKSVGLKDIGLIAYGVIEVAYVRQVAVVTAPVATTDASQSTGQRTLDESKRLSPPPAYTHSKKTTKLQP